MINGIIRSPLFYVGDKYKLIEQLKSIFPSKINNFYEPFVGGGSVFLNVKADNYYLNDINKNLINIHRFLMKNKKNPGNFYNKAEEIIQKYNLSRSYKEDIIPKSLKKEFKKTYFARYNKDGYEKLRECVNEKKKNDPLILYLLLIYGFNRMLRFNGGGKFNLPVGNVDFNKNVVNALNSYFEYAGNKKIVWTSSSFKGFISKKNYSKDACVDLDPP